MNEKKVETVEFTLSHGIIGPAPKLVRCRCGGPIGYPAGDDYKYLCLSCDARYTRAELEALP